MPATQKMQCSSENQWWGWRGKFLEFNNALVLAPWPCKHKVNTWIFQDSWMNGGYKSGASSLLTFLWASSQVEMWKERHWFEKKFCQACHLTWCWLASLSLQSLINLTTSVFVKLVNQQPAVILLSLLRPSICSFFRLFTIAPSASLRWWKCTLLTPGQLQAWIPTQIPQGFRWNATVARRHL